MFGIVAAQEVKTLAANRTWWAVLGLLIVLTILAAFNGVARVNALAEVGRQLNQDESSLQASLKSGAARYEASPVGDPPAVTSPGNVGLSLLGHYAVMSYGPFAALSVGQSDVQPAYFRVTAHPPHSFLNASEIQNPLNQVSGSFDVAFVMIFVLPILIIAISFDLMSREKEGGTLALVAAQGVRLRDLILAKILVRAAFLLTTLLLLVFTSSAIIGANLSDGGALLQLLTWYAVIAAYAFFWFALALAINALNWPSVTNGVVLANVWLVFVVVIPSFVNVAASTLYPAPSRVELTTEIREATELADKQAASAREDYLFDHPELAGAGATPDAFYVQVLATGAAIEKVAGPILAKFDELAGLRETAVARLQYLSPAIATQQALNALAQTGNETFTDFTRQALAFHEEWRGFFVARIIKGERMTAAAFDAIPTFAYNAPTTTATVSAAAPTLIFLTVIVVLLTAWSARRFARFPIV